MDQQELIDRLEARVADVPVGAPPIGAMRSAARRRRGRTAVLAAAAAVAVIATGAFVWQSDGPVAGPQPPVASDPPGDPDAPPDGHRYVGIGSAVIAVPDAWGTNKTECGTPQRDTVVIDVGVTCAALIPRPAGVESIEVRRPYPTVDIGNWTPFEVAGRPALRAPDSYEGSFGADLLRATVYLPEERTMFVVESSSPDRAAVVDRLLAGIDVLEEHTTVPGFQTLSYDRDPSPARVSYTRELQSLGLSVEVIEEKSSLNPGDVLAADPAVGSVVAPGDTVRVTVAR